MQKANVLPPSRPRKTHQVTCFRDGVIMMRLQCGGDAQARTLAQMWDTGKTMGEMAQIMKDMGLKI